MVGGGGTACRPKGSNSAPALAHRAVRASASRSTRPSGREETTKAERDAGPRRSPAEATEATKQVARRRRVALCQSCERNMKVPFPEGTTHDLHGRAGALWYQWCLKSGETNLPAGQPKGSNPAPFSPGSGVAAEGAPPRGVGEVGVTWSPKGSNPAPSLPPKSAGHILSQWSKLTDGVASWRRGRASRVRTSPAEAREATSETARRGRKALWKRLERSIRVSFPPGHRSGLHGLAIALQREQVLAGRGERSTLGGSHEG